MSFVANGTSRFNSGNNMTDNSGNSAEPAPMERLNWLIHLLHVRGETNLCRKLIQNEIENSNGCNEFAYFKQAIIFREEGKVQEALESFQLCHKLNSQSTNNIKEIGKCLFLLHRFRLALDAYIEADRSSGKPDWQILHNIGECYGKLGDASKAKEYIHRAVQVGKQEVSYAVLVKLLTAEGDYKSSVAVANAAVETCPDSVTMLTECGLLHLKMGQTQLAFERLSSALALDPSSSRALLGIGCITQSHEEHDVALSKYKIAVQVAANSVALWNNIGMCFYSKQKYIAAVTCLKRALWHSPLNWRVLLNLSVLHLATQQAASAFNFACAAVNIRSDVPLAFALLGCTLLELHDTDNALKAFRQAALLAPEDRAIAINLALCLYRRGVGRREVANSATPATEQDPVRFGINNDHGGGADALTEAAGLVQRVRSLGEHALSTDLRALCERLYTVLPQLPSAPLAEEANKQLQEAQEDQQVVAAEEEEKVENSGGGVENGTVEQGDASAELIRRELEDDEV